MEILENVREIQKFLKERRKVLLEDLQQATIQDAVATYGDPLPPNKIIISKDDKNKKVYIQVSAGT